MRSCKHLLHEIVRWRFAEWIVREAQLCFFMCSDMWRSCRMCDNLHACLRNQMLQRESL